VTVRPGDALPTLRVTPAADLPHRYAEASGDDNPIHTDPEFARRMGLPGNVLHGLYGMALVARAVTDGAGCSSLALRRLSVQFRGLALPEQEIAVEATVRECDGEQAIVDCSARQGATRIIRRAVAELNVR
jgi:3-hydroxybutyryl-CoA dehydratase